MRGGLQLRLSQHLTLTPQLQQSIRLLQLSTLDLNQELEQFLQDNPLLEREDESDDPGSAAVALDSPSPGESSATSASGASEAAPEERPVDAPADAAEQAWDMDMDGTWDGDEGGGGEPAPEEDEGRERQQTGEATLREHLLAQVGLLGLPPRDRALIELLIDAIDEDGLLGQPLDEILDLLPAEAGIEREELDIALRHLQNLEPTGVGARSLGECLALQLRALPPDTPGRAEAIVVVSEHLDALAARDFTRLRRLLRCDEDRLRTVQSLVSRLNPRPGAQHSAAQARYVIPDVIVRRIRGAWTAALNPEAMPRLRVNRLYADILRRHRDASHAQLAGQLQEARWLIKNVQQRFDTILRVSQAIVQRQRRFFDHGPVAMRPLVLREIADELGLHESTVSRVTTQKFMLTPRGIFELKYFFGSHVATEAGGECSATAIRALIRQLVAAEDRRQPLSDSRIAEILGEQGIVVARRTVAKYRESLQILPVNLRKSL
jgi:RNA polymerase sigma-54 factor